jgi:mRNA interferase RelE/StbE
MVDQATRRRLKVAEDMRQLIRHAHPDLKRRIRAALHVILHDPSAGKALVEDLAGLHSFRIGRIRIIYRVVSDQTIEIVTIGPRKTVYEETFSLLKQ